MVGLYKVNFKTYEGEFRNNTLEVYSLYALENLIKIFEESDHVVSYEIFYKEKKVNNLISIGSELNVKKLN